MKKQTNYKICPVCRTEFLKTFNRDRHIKSMYSKLEFDNETHVESSNINADTYVNKDVVVTLPFTPKYRDRF